MWWNSCSVSEPGSTDNYLRSTDALALQDLIKPADWDTRRNRVSWFTEWKWEEGAEKDQFRRESSTENPPHKEWTNWSSRGTWDPLRRKEWEEKCLLWECWTLIGWEKTEPTNSSKWSAWTPDTTRSETTEESTGSATQSTNTENSEDLPELENKPEASMSKDTETQRSDPPREPTTREETKSVYSDTDDFLLDY